ncbi:MAG: hypothetical protein LH606_02030 [Cytophagaceae bacterium]|nr:hypothetical protein [Cytophagaceae bacterium]
MPNFVESQPAMTTIFELHEQELDAKFLRSVKALFRNQRLRVVIEAETEEGKTKFIDPERLLQAAENVREGKRVKILTFEELDELEAKVSL